MLRRVPPHHRSLGVWLALTAASCGGSSGDDGLGGSELAGAGTVSCQEDERVDTYTANMEKPGELGLLSFRFSDLTPAPPAKGSNTFHVAVTDASGTISGGELRVELDMPDHGHGSSIKPVISFDAASGQYTIQPLYLFMAGVWRLEFDAYDGTGDSAQPLDRAILHFCIEG
jgi:hypothetical protein